jgi:DNA-binding MarR family transcriptional regulator
LPIARFLKKIAKKITRGGVKMRDEVDRLIAAWKLQRPDLDLAPLAVLSRVTRISRQLDITRRSAFADLETWGFDVLAALRRAGAPYQLSPSALMAETLVTSGTMTNRLDRLEEIKLITREPDPTDGRGSLVTLTKNGMSAVDSALEDLLGREEELLSALTKEEQIDLARLLSKLVNAFQ